MNVQQQRPPSSLVTTAIDYPNGEPHIGHALEKVQADVFVRAQRLAGRPTRFSMGLDENSLHVLREAIRQQVDPQTWLTEKAGAFTETWACLEVQPDRWVRTTETAHAIAAQTLFRRVQENGDIRLGVYSGLYCGHCNLYLSEDDLVDGRCPDHPSITPEWLEEENYFFRLSKYAAALRHHIESHPEFIVPAVQRAEILRLIDHGLRDFSVSRQIRPGSRPWGIPVPGDDSQIIYVWFDALANYLTVVGFPDDQELFDQYWPADVHLIGKNITRFHAVYWPAMLLAAGLPLPRQIAAHGFMTLEGKRISKTTGNVVSPREVVHAFGVDAVRYYLMREFPFGADGNFSRANLIRRYNHDLANDVGNLVHRVVAMITRYRGGLVPDVDDPGPWEHEIMQAAADAHEQAPQSIAHWEFDEAIRSIWTLVRRTNQYIEDTRPWLLAQVGDDSRLNTVLAISAEAIRQVALLLTPIVPSGANRIRTQLGLAPMTNGAWSSHGSWGSEPLHQVVPGPAVFPRLELDMGLPEQEVGFDQSDLSAG